MSTRPHLLRVPVTARTHAEAEDRATRAAAAYFNVPPDQIRVHDSQADARVVETTTMICEVKSTVIDADTVWWLYVADEDEDLRAQLTRAK